MIIDDRTRRCVFQRMIRKGRSPNGGRFFFSANVAAHMEARRPEFDAVIMTTRGNWAKGFGKEVST